MGFREHGLMLFLGPELLIGLTKLRADKELGRSYGGLLTFTEGLHVLGYLKDSDYEILIKKYNTGLIKPKELSIQELKTVSKQEKMAKKFSMVLDQWSTHPNEKWRNRWIAEAKTWKNKIQNAQLILELADDKVPADD